MLSVQIKIRNSDIGNKLVNLFAADKVMANKLISMAYSKFSGKFKVTSTSVIPTSNYNGLSRMGSR